MSRLLLGAYGGGAAPVVNNLAADEGASAIVVNGSYVVVENLAVRAARSAAVWLGENSNHNVVRGMNISGTGFGVTVNGNEHLIVDNDVKNLTVIKNTPGGDDDYGAVGFVVNGIDNEVAYNTCTLCRGASFDYGYDGGFVEVWNNGDRLSVHHNIADRTNGFFELGAESGSYHANDIKVTNNIIKNTGSFLVVNQGAKFRIQVKNLQISRNTIVQRGGYSGKGYQQLIYPGSNRDDLVVTNNIFYLSGDPELFVWWGDSGASFTHSNNVFYVTGGSKLGAFKLGPGDTQAEPHFVNVSSGDYRLRAGNSTIDAGFNSG